MSGTSGVDPQLEEPDEGDPGGTPAASDPAAPGWAKNLEGGITSLNQTLKGLMEMAQAQQQQLQAQQQQQAQQQEPEEEDEPPIDLEVLSRADFAKHLTGQVLKALDKQVVTPLTQQMQQLSGNAQRMQLGRDVETMRAQHKDFGDWQSEMISLAKSKPSLSVTELYHLARAYNPTKTQQLDRKYNPAPNDGGGSVTKIRFGGLLPSQSGTGTRARNMNGKEAVEAAWAETVAALGGEPSFEE